MHTHVYCRTNIFEMTNDSRPVPWGLCPTPPVHVRLNITETIYIPTIYSIAPFDKARIFLLVDLQTLIL